MQGSRLVAKISEIAQAAILRQGKILIAGQFFDVDVLERNHTDVLDETGRTVNVPDPGVLQGQVEVDFPVRAAGLKVNVVGQIEPPLRLYNVAEQTDYIPVFAVELQLHVGFIVLKVLGTHGSILHHLPGGMRQTGNGNLRDRTYSWSGPVRCQLVRW